MLRAVNRARQIAGYQRIPASVIRFKHRIVKVFGIGTVANEEAERRRNIRPVAQVSELCG